LEEEFGLSTLRLIGKSAGGALVGLGMDKDPCDVEDVGETWKGGGWEKEVLVQTGERTEGPELLRHLERARLPEGNACVWRMGA